MLHSLLTSGMKKLVVCTLKCTYNFFLHSNLHSNITLGTTVQKILPNIYIQEPKVFNYGFKYEISRSFGSLMHPSYVDETFILIV